MPVVIPHTESPAVSVLIVVYGGGEVAVDVMRSLVEHTEQPFEVIVLDNASARRLRTSDSGRSFRGETIDRGEEPRLRAGQQPSGARGSGPVICMLNPDARVTSGWLEPLLAALEDPLIGAVAPALIGADGELQEAGAMVDHWGYTGPIGTRGFGQPVPAPSGPLAVDYASAACLLMRGEVFRSLDGFDPTYRLAYYEDVDLCMRMWEQRLQVWAVPASRVIHLGGKTVTPVVSQALWHHNRSVFLHRWREELERRPSFASGSDEEIERLWAWRTGEYDQANHGESKP